MLGKKCEVCGLEAWLNDAGEQDGKYTRVYVCDNGHRQVVTAQSEEQAYELARLRRLNRLLRRFDADEDAGDASD